MTYVVDRLEGDMAVLVADDRSKLDVPLAQLPEGTREGACLTRRANGSWAPAPAEETKRRQRIQAKMDNLFQPRS